MAPNPLIVRLDGSDWDLTASEELERLLLPAFDCADAIVDMSQVEYMDSTCLGKLTRLHHERVTKRGLSPARLVIASAAIQRLFQIVNFDRVWPIYGSLESATNGHGLQNGDARRHPGFDSAQ